MVEQFDPLTNSRTPETKKSVDDLTSKLIVALRNGDAITPALKEELQTLLSQNSQAIQPAAVEVSVDLATKFDQVWKERQKYGYAYGEEISLETRKRIDRISAAMIESVGFVSARTKRSRGEDWTTRSIYSAGPNPELRQLSKRIIKSFQQSGESNWKLKFPDAQGMLSYYGASSRPITIFNDPDHEEKQIVACAIHDPTLDASGRLNDGGSYITFSLDRNNVVLRALKEGKLDPRDMMTALVNVALVFEPGALDIMKFSGGHSPVTVLDYSSYSIIKYGQNSTDVDMRISKDIPEFLSNIRDLSIMARDYYETIPGFNT